MVALKVCVTCLFIVIVSSADFDEESVNNAEEYSKETDSYVLLTTTQSFARVNQQLEEYLGMHAKYQDKEVQAVPQLNELFQNSDIEQSIESQPEDKLNGSYEDTFLKLNTSRVNGGRPVNEVIPYQVSLQLQQRDGSWRHFCGGSIISAHHVLTAAHCIHSVKVSAISVVCGTVRWRYGGQRYHVVAKHVHPNYTMSSGVYNDVAILKVKPTFQLNQHSISTISLAGPSRLGQRTPVRLSGWGSVYPTAAKGLPEQLQMLDYYTISNHECRQRGFRVSSKELCALGHKGKGACVGDSGGPLVITQGTPQLVGIVSYGTSKCAQAKPDVYTRVSSFLPYINKIINEDLK